MNDTYTYEIDMNATEEFNDKGSKKFDTFNAKQKEGEIISFTIRAPDQRFLELKNVLTQYSQDKIKKEKFAIKAITNLIIKNNFLELSLELAEGQIDENEFELEIEKNEDKYFIHTKNLDNPKDIFIISNLVKQIKFDLTTDDVADMFSLDSNELETISKKLK